MSNLLETLFSNAVSYINNEKIKFDEDKARALSHRLGTISSTIENAVTQINGPISESQPVWTGEAADNFFSELNKLINETQAIVERGDQNRKAVDTAISVLLNAENKVGSDVSQLSAKNTFINS